MQTELAIARVHNQTVELRVRDLLLNALTVSSGAVDAISFLALGKVFSAFMTGNIAFLGLRVARAPAPGAVSILVSMAAFAVGVYLSTRIVKPSESSGMWSQRVTVALGVSLIAHAIFLDVWFATKGQPPIDVAHILLGLWGVAMGMQSAAVRRLQVTVCLRPLRQRPSYSSWATSSTGATTVAERRRLAGVLVSLFLGATAGGLLLVHAHIYAPVLPFVITVAVVATAAIVLRERGVTDEPQRSKSRSKVEGIC